MRIDEVITEKEFGLGARIKQGAKNLGNTIAGKVSKTAYNKSIQGKVRAQGLKGANKISDAYLKWTAAKYPDQDQNYLNSGQFKEFMKTSNVLKGQQAAGFPMFAGLPSVQKAFKQNDDVNFDAQTKQEIFLAIAMAQQPGVSNQAQGTQLGGGTTDPNELSQIQQALTKMTDAQKIALINMASQQVQQ
jgi:hypothetical protein